MSDLVSVLVIALFGLSHWGIAKRFRPKANPRLSLLFHLWLLGGLAWILFSVLTVWPFGLFRMSLPEPLHYLRGLGFAYALGCLFGYVLLVFVESTGYLIPSRRQLLGQAAKAAALLPIAGAGYGAFLERKRIDVSEVKLSVKGLPRELDGLRLALLSDIHYGPYFGREDLERAIGLTNELRPHLIFVTGDMITSRGDPLDECLLLLTKLQPEIAVVGCLGNHEIYARAEDYAEQRGRQLGIDFLRQRRRVFQFGQAKLNVVGVDYQRSSRRYLVDVEKHVDPSAFNVLLSHNPDVFPVATEKGFQLVLAGHTHGGQVNVEFIDPRLNPARFITPFVRGLYRINDSYEYVTRGLGTVGLPVRLGSPPEVALIELCAT